VLRKLTRRNFLKWSLYGGIGLCLTGCQLVAPGERNEQEKEETDPEERTDKKKEDKNVEAENKHNNNGLLQRYPVPRRYLGKTGLTVSILGLGGAIAVAQNNQEKEAEAIVNRAIDMGINYIDTAPTYGHSEKNIGRVIAGRRREVCLASKTEERTYEGAMKDFERSMQNLGTDYLDLLQLHGVHREEDWQELQRSNGAIKALEELKYYGNVGHLGITGHKNASLLKQTIKEYPFDCVLMTVNCGDVHEDSFIKEVLPVAQEKEMGIIGMKVASYGRIFRENAISSMGPALNYALTHPVSTAVVGVSDIAELEENVGIAKNFVPLTEEKMKELEDLTYSYKREVNFFKYEW